MGNCLKNLIISVFLLTVLGCGAGSSGGRQASPDKAADRDSLIIELTGVEGRTVFEITREHHQLQYIESPVGNFVEAIDSISINGDYSWNYSVNDSIGQVASDKFITKNGDRIKWHYRKQ